MKIPFPLLRHTRVCAGQKPTSSSVKALAGRCPAGPRGSQEEYTPSLKEVSLQGQGSLQGEPLNSFWATGWYPECVENSRTTRGQEHRGQVAKGEEGRVS